MDPRPSLSFVIPLYRSEETIVSVLEAIDRLAVPGGHEVVLVNDGSPDNTEAVVRECLDRLNVPVTLVVHARNYGEHNAVMTGLRHARGDFVITMDDDGQNPPEEALKLWREARERDLDCVFGLYAEKRHSPWRNVGSAFCNRIADWVLDKPNGLYLSSFRCLSAFLVGEIINHQGPFPYIDGLIFQVTRRVGSVTVEHRDRAAGRSGYTFRRLVRLWLSMFVNFSVLPLRVATLAGAGMAAFGLIALILVFYWHFTENAPWGWGSIMAALLVFSGTQLVVLGVIGEYVGRTYLTANLKPQAVVRRVVSSRETSRQASEFVARPD